jgi:choice-of-anchor A domain-containing protein
MKTPISFVALAVLMAGGISSRADINSVLSQWNVITSGDLSQVTDIGGSAYIGGNVGDQNSFTTASIGSTAISAGQISFAVAGNVAGGNPINVNGGSVAVGGNEGGRAFNFNGGGRLLGSSALPASPVSQVAADSQYWSGLTANSAVTYNSSGQLSFNCTAGNSLSIFNINASLLSSSLYNGQNVQGYTITGAGTGDILINVTGDLSAVANNFLSSFDSLGGHILFNFFNASTVTLNGAIYGYVVAPDATVMENNDIYGGVMAHSLNLNGEVNLPVGATSATAWEGTFLPNVVAIPESSTAIPAFGALAVAAGLFWPRKASTNRA